MQPFSTEPNGMRGLCRRTQPNLHANITKFPESVRFEIDSWAAYSRGMRRTEKYQNKEVFAILIPFGIKNA